MSLTLGDNFSYQAAKPLDARLKYDTLANMKAVADATMYDGCLAYCVATDKTYQWKSTNTVDSTTGRWREFSSGGGGGTSDYSDLDNKPSINSVTLSGDKSGASLKLYSTTDNLLSGDDLDDEDKFPVYDYSQSTPKNIRYSDLQGALTAFYKTGLVLNCECSDSASTANKKAAITSIFTTASTIVAGTKVKVKFTYGNTYATPTLALKVSTTALSANIAIKEIDDTGAFVTPTTWWTAGQYVDFIYDGTYWIMLTDLEGGGSISELNDIGDVDISSPTDGQGLIYDGTNSKWVNGNAGSVPMIGTIDRGFIYDTTEKVIGKWIDGRPLYQKVINLNGLSNGTKTVAHGITNLESVTSIRVYGKASYSGGANVMTELPFMSGSGTVAQAFISGNNIQLDCRVNMSDYTEAYAVLQYTKTTDAENSYNYTNENDYSTSEKICGTWVDGSTLYQKTIQLTTTQMTGKSVIQHGISNFGRAIDVQGIYFYTDNGTAGSAPLFYNYSVSGDVAAYSACIRFRQTDFVFSFTNSYLTPVGAYITVKYIKTS